MCGRQICKCNFTWSLSASPPINRIMYNYLSYRLTACLPACLPFVYASHQLPVLLYTETSGYRIISQQPSCPSSEEKRLSQGPNPPLCRCEYEKAFTRIKSHEHCKQSGESRCALLYWGIEGKIWRPPSSITIFAIFTTIVTWFHLIVLTLIW